MLFRSNGHPVLKSILKYALDPNIKFLLPEGVPPYKPNVYDEPKALLAEANRIYLFIEGGNPNLKPLRREQMFIQMLEYVSPNDAVLLLAMKDKKLPFKNITKEMVREAFPGLLSDEQTKQTQQV